MDNIFMMNIDSFHYFLIVLSGFMFVWSFRHYSLARKDNIKDFEYLGFSTFWGILIFAGYAWYTQDQPEKVQFLVKNPLFAGIFLSVIGFGLGFVTGSAKGWVKSKIGL